MSNYKLAFLTIGILITAISVMPFMGGLFELNPVQILTFGGIPCLWWFAYNGLQKSRKGAHASSLTLVCLMCGLLLTGLIQRQMFVVRNHSMEGPNGEGSPLAFLLGLAFELFFFVLFAIVAWLGFAALREKKREQPSGE